ncbi:helix-turn-helix transcriptional regulator [Clostridium sp. HBUAS56010]|uniref:helix-turn-helix domain-containing protein n=1 Tax=Clostridium sp. HBUAS56010 TaxID=2571127 RepID=UPI001178A45C|nr:helix-turn-helix transcriptional regulator [Clostridium sp. HBUAS56010]
MYEVFEALLAKHGITIYKFCKDTGVSQSTIYTWKKKRYLVGPEIGGKICDYFGISMDCLMTGKEPDEKKKPAVPSIADRDIARKFDNIIGDINDPNGSPLYFDGIELNEKEKEIMASFVTNMRQEFELIKKMAKKK